MGTALKQRFAFGWIGYVSVFNVRLRNTFGGMNERVSVGGALQDLRPHVYLRDSACRCVCTRVCL